MSTKNSDINDMITSTPKKAVSYETNLVNCLICAESLEKTDRIAVFGRSQQDLKEDLRGADSRILGEELQPTNQGSQFVCIKKCFARLKKVENMSSTLKTLHDELRAEASKAAAVRIKRERVHRARTCL